MFKKEWLWMSDCKNTIGLQGGDYYKPVQYKERKSDCDVCLFDSAKKD